MPIDLPGTDALPEGPIRCLTEAVHQLYRGAGKPGVRPIAKATRDGDYRDVASHQTVAAILRGAGVPRWSKLEVVVRVLSAWHTPPLNVTKQVANIQELWHATREAPVSANQAEPHKSVAKPPSAPSTASVATAVDLNILKAMHRDRAAERAAEMDPAELAEKLTSTRHHSDEYDDWYTYSLVDPGFTLDLLERMQIVQAATVLAELAQSCRMKILKKLSEDKMRALIEVMPESIAAAVLSNFSVRRATSVLQCMTPEFATGLLRRMPIDRKLLNTIDLKVLCLLANTFEPDQLLVVLGLIDPQRAAAVVIAMNPSQAREILVVLPSDRTKVVVDSAEPKWIAVALAKVIPDVAATILGSMQRTDRLAVVLNELAPETVTAVMTTLHPWRARAVRAAMPSRPQAQRWWRRLRS